ncbi:MAG TPA: adenylate/guanylate cyclase domain-containing protein [Candidatus Dormibacteraeota bacterium]|nr:adenylate/guanylate cyclase domain-containing protein [Candidatus Dormibacteraeota bacterium]
MSAPEVRYTKSGDVNIAYATVGDGPFDIVFVSGWILSNLEGAWDGPATRFYERLASVGRLILFDKRGTGISDRSEGIPDLETRMDDVRAVMDAVGSQRAAIVGASEGGPMSILFAATYPERVAALVLYGTGTTWTRKDDYPWRPTREERIPMIHEVYAGLGTKDWIRESLRETWAPSLELDDAYVDWFARWVRLSGSPGAVEALANMNTDIDVRHVLSAVRAPTLVVHRVDDTDIQFDEGQYIADRIPGARMVALDGADHGWWVHSEQLVDEMEPFLRGVWERGEWDVVERDRVLATVLFTDIVGSTARLAELGDRAWREVLGSHHAAVRRQLLRYSGKEMDTAGDGFFAYFDGPARAIRCACAISDSVKDLGIEVRQGLHTGECELVDSKIGGIAVHIGARVAQEAGPSEVLVSSTVHDLVAGSGIRFQDRGAAALKGIPGEWKLYRVDAESVALPRH